MPHTCASRGRKEVSDSLELELQTNLSGLMWVLQTERGTPGKALLVLSHLCSPAWIS